MKKNAIVIYKASAGSGKTFMLTRHFLSLALNAEKNYRRILAITFTRKATAEMRQRILQELYIIAKNPEKSDHAADICRELNITTKEISDKAKKSITQIMHDYSNFSVTTIDQFFQRIIRNFTRELNIAYGYRIELGENKVLERAILTMLENAMTNEPLKQLLNKYIKEYVIVEERNHAIEKEIIRSAKTMLREDLKNAFIKIADGNFEEEIAALQTEMRKKIKIFEHECKHQYENFVNTVKKEGLQLEDLRKSGNKIRKYYQKSENINFEEELIEKIFDDDFCNFSESDLFTKEYIKKNSVVASKLLSTITHVFKADTTYFKENFPYYFLSKNAISKLWYLQFFRHIWRELNKIKQNENLFILSDSPVLLAQLTTESDTPFIFERIANTYNHILIDEFQDTSKLQWKNLKPLYDHIVSQFNTSTAKSTVNSLLVGDVKQAIYRFRNGNWELLHNTVLEQFKNFGIREEFLQTNWRSEPVIINFNNTMFSLLPQTVGWDYLHGMPESYKTKLQQIYKNQEQQCSPKKKNANNGHVAVYTIEEEEYEQKTAIAVAQQVVNLLSSGVRPGEIAILVRKAKHGQTIAQQLLTLNSKNTEQTIQIATSDVLTLDNSNAVLSIIAMLTYLVNSEEFYLTSALWYRWQLRNDSYITFFETPYETQVPAFFETDLEQLKRMPIFQIVTTLIDVLDINIKPEIPFLACLQDTIIEYIENNPTDIHSFLDYWEEEGANTKLTASKTQNAIQIMTIHKSKGLEFEHVIVPFVDEAIVRKGNDFWISNPKNSDMPPIQVPFVKTAAFSTYKGQLYEEYFNMTVDSINILYVAFTRAVKSLSIYIRQKPDNGTVGKWIKDAFQQAQHWAGEVNPENSVLYTHGILSDTQKTDKKDFAVNDTEITQFFLNKTLTLGIKTTDRHYVDNQGEVSKTELGSALHRIMEKIRTVNDIDNAIKEISIKGTISDSEIPILKKKIEYLLSQPSVKHWFDGSVKTFNEQVLIDPSGKIRRPDRIMQTSDNKWIVVDYKFGSENNSTYEEQIRNYVALLNNSGKIVTAAYIWYMSENNIHQVL